MSIPKRPGDTHWTPDDEFYKNLHGIPNDGLAPTGPPDDGYRGISREPLPSLDELPDELPTGKEDLPIGKALYEYLCGTAGTGKTYLAKRLKESDPKGVELAATTGIAAVNLGEGTTIHALLRFFDTQSLKDAFRNGTLQAQIRRLRRAGLRRLIIDEVSMLSGEQLGLITKAFAEINDRTLAGQLDEEDVVDDSGDGDSQDESKEDTRASKAHRGKKPDWPVGITLVGDFAQLPPVPDKDAVTMRNLPVQYAFESHEWKRYAPNVVKLETIHRQTDLEFIRALHAIRRGDVTTALAFFTPDKFSDSTDENFEGTTIYAKNLEVDRHNMLKLEELAGVEMQHSAIRTGKQRGDWKQIPDRLELKEGALVMLLANRREFADEEDERGTIVYANGDLGTLMRRSPGADAWVVKLQRTGAAVWVYPKMRENTVPMEPGRKKEIKAEIHAEAVRTLGVVSVWREVVHGEGQDPSTRLVNAAIETLTADELKGCLEYQQFTQSKWAARVSEDGKHEIVGTVTYMPMRAAYGCTVHKTQGLTLDRVQINIRDPFFAHPGMLFVALSRCRSADGLRIVGNQRGFLERCKIAPKVMPWL